MVRFSFDDVQADAIVKMRLGQLSGLERQKIEDELGALHMKIAEYEAVLADENKVKAIVKEECLKMRDKYGDERRTEISIVSGEVDIEDLIPEEECVLTLTDVGYIKRQPVDSYAAQRRGGKGIKGLSTREEDVIRHMFVCSSHDYVMFFTNQGRVYKLKCFEIPEGSRTAKGMNIINLLALQPEEKVTAMIPLEDYTEGRDLNMITCRGIIKRTRLDAYNKVRRGGLIDIELDEGDELVSVRTTEGQSDLLVATKKGMAIRFDETGARLVGRTARGVKAINLAADDEIVGMVPVEEDKLLLAVSATGYGRLSSFDEYRRQSRGGKGLTNYHTEKYGDVVGIAAVTPEEDLILMASNGVMIRMLIGEIRQCSRTSKGVTVMRLPEDAAVVSIATTEHEEGEELAHPEGDAENEAQAEDTPVEE